MEESYLPSQHGKRFSPIYYLTLSGSPSYGVPDEPSVFTAALMFGLKGAGSDNIDTHWKIYTVQLSRALEHLIKRSVKDDAIDQVSTSARIVEMIL
jgi:hypothetical protein